MKEAPMKNLPPKVSTGVGGNIGAKSTNHSFLRATNNDEILSTLLRINNFDSISSIKDESLDIDLSACVTFNADASGIINGNSLSSSDFWRVLDESAQNVLQLDPSNIPEEGGGGGNTSNSMDMCNTSADNNNSLTCVMKPEIRNSFSDTFLRPEPPTLLTISPLKKLTTKTAIPLEQFNTKQIANPKTKSTSAIVADQHLERKKAKTFTTAALQVKQEPPEQLLAADDDSLKSNTNSNNSSPECSIAMISKSSFNIHLSPPRDNTNRSACVDALLTADTVKLSKSKLDSQNGSSANTIVKVDTASVADLQPLFKCEDCNGLLLSGLKEYGFHIALSHKILHKCHECQKDFENAASLKKHVRTHRTMESRKDAWKKCPDCGKCLKLGSMWMHRKIHSDNKKYGCDICGQKFVQKINLTHHARVHTAEKPFECPECQKRFQERSHLQRHQKYHAQTRSYRCEKCGKMYKTERCLKVHNLVHLEQRPFACNVCEKSFISNSKLKQHSNIHTGERPFKCNYCPRDFTNFPNWLKHTRRRHKVDHKTGEHLENIPSYCSKKSKATAKVDKAPSTNTAETSKPMDVPKSTDASIIKPPVKRKKKVTPPPQPQLDQRSDLILTSKTSESSITLKGTVKDRPVSFANNTATTAEAKAKSIKTKRERKQTTPKQLQKHSSAAVDFIKKEIVDCVERKAIEEGQQDVANATNFPDLHCLSLTSAEELIMEQALEMEECGLYDATPVAATVIDMDNNAVSAESATEALHFQIKNEFIDIKEEFINLSDGVNNRLICSSLESSPYSSPASTCGVLPAANSVNNSSTPATQSHTTVPLYISSLRLNSNTMATVKATTATTASTKAVPVHTLPQSIQQQIVQQQKQHQQQQQEQLRTTSLLSNTLLNHLYVPFTMSMPFIVQPQSSQQSSSCTTQQQTLPSVDTLLFTHANNTNYFRNKSSAAEVSQATTHNNL